MSKNDLVEKLLDLDLMPLGKREALPVKRTKQDIPSFKELFSVDSESLYKDFLKYTTDNNGYISSREHLFSENNIDIKEYKDHMNFLGFKKGHYTVFPLRNINGDLTISTDSYTYNFLKNWPTGIFRPQYNVALDNWKANTHIDHNNNSVHGFRVLIPLNKSSNIEINNTVHVLNLNKSYFIDVTKPHAAWAKKGRVVLSLQMDSDILL